MITEPATKGDHLKLHSQDQSLLSGNTSMSNSYPSPSQPVNQTNPYASTSDNPFVLPHPRVLALRAQYGVPLVQERGKIEKLRVNGKARKLPSPRICLKCGAVSATTVGLRNACKCPGKAAGLQVHILIWTWGFRDVYWL